MQRKKRSFLQFALLRCRLPPTDSRMEMDFLVQSEGGLLPIEVKGGTRIKATSLHHYLAQHKGMRAVRFSMPSPAPRHSRDEG